MTRSEVSNNVDGPKSGIAQMNRQSAMYESVPSWSGNQGQSINGSSSWGRSRFPHIKDLQDDAEAIIKEYRQYMSVSHAAHASLDLSS